MHGAHPSRICHSRNFPVCTLWCACLGNLFLAKSSYGHSTNCKCSIDCRDFKSVWPLRDCVRVTPADFPTQVKTSLLYGRMALVGNKSRAPTSHSMSAWQPGVLGQQEVRFCLVALNKPHTILNLQDQCSLQLQNRVPGRIAAENVLSYQSLPILNMSN